MQKFLFIILFLSNIAFAIDKTTNKIDYIRENSFLFCLKKDSPDLVLENERNSIITNNKEINSLLQKFEIKSIDKWLQRVSEFDHDGDIYLSKIYRVIIEKSDLNKIDIMKNEFQKLNVIHSVEYEYRHKPFYNPNDTYFDYQFYLEQVNALDAWDYFINEEVNFSNSDILLASIDSGVDYVHPDLKSNLFVNQLEIPQSAINMGIDSNNDQYVSSLEIEEFLINSNMDNNNDGIINLRDLFAGGIFLDEIDGDGNGYIDDIIGWDAINGIIYDDYGNFISFSEDNDPFPKEGSNPFGSWAHGTHVGGLLSATTDNSLGIASVSFDSKLLSVKIADDNQEGEDIWFDATIEGMYYAAFTGHNLDKFTVLNCSFGRLGEYSEYEQAAINIMHYNYNAIIVVAAGNESSTQCSYPACYDNVISVSALDVDGVTAAPFTNYGEEVDISAPGVGILSTIQYLYENTIDSLNYIPMNGTSMATPIVSSGIALLKNYFPDYSNEEIVQRLLVSSNPIIYNYNPVFYNNKLGYGIMDLKNAIDPYLPSINLTLNNYLFESYVSDLIEINFTVTNISLANINLHNMSLSLICEDLSYESNMDSVFFETFTSSSTIEESFILSLNNNDLGNYSCHILLESDEYTNQYSFNISINLFQQGFPFDTNSQVDSSPLAVDLDGNGSLEIIFGDYAGLIHVLTIDGQNWNTDIFPYDTGDQIWSSPAAADIDLDGYLDFVISSKNKNLYAFDQNGIKFIYDAEQFLIGTPSIGNIDFDEELEVVIGGYESSGDIFAVNHDGSTVAGFPFEVNDKIKSASLCDFNNNNLDDIVITTDGDDIIAIIYDGLSMETLLTANNKFKSSPSIIKINDDYIIMAGSYDDNMYAVSHNGENIFNIEANDNVDSSVSFVDIDGDGTPYAFFGSDDGFLYAVNMTGEALPGWPVNIGDDINNSVSFADLDGDGAPEAIIGVLGNLYAYHMDGSLYDKFPISYEFPFTSNPLILDLDGDNDLEILLGTSGSLVSIDIMEQGILDSYWNQDRANNKKTGYYELNSTDCENFIYGDVNCDAEVSILDIIMLVDIIITSSDYDLTADINIDGIINVIDIISIINTIIAD